MSSIPTDIGLRSVPGHSIDTSTPEAVLIKGAIYQDAAAERLVPSRHQMYLIAPYSGCANGTNQNWTGQQVQFRIQPNLVTGRIRHADLEFTVAETGGASSVTPASAPYLFQQMWVGLNGQPQNQSQILYGYSFNQFYVNLMFKTMEELQNMNGASLNLMNMNITSFQGETAIAPSGTALIIQSLESLLIAKITPNTLSNDVWLTIVLPTSSPAVAGSGTLQLQSMNLRLYNELNDAVDYKVAEGMKMFPSVINYMHNYLQTFTQSLTAGTQVALPLTGLAGAKAAQVVVFVQSAANNNTYTAGGIRTYIPLGGTGTGDASTTSPGFIDMRIAAGTSIISGGVNSPPFFLRSRSVHMTGTPGYLTSNVPGIYPILLSDGNGNPYDASGSPGFYRSAWWEGGYTINWVVNKQLRAREGPHRLNRQAAVLLLSRFNVAGMRC